MICIVAYLQTDISLYTEWCNMNAQYIIYIKQKYSFQMPEKKSWKEANILFLWYRGLFLQDLYESHHLHHIHDGLIQDCRNSSALVVELLQFCVKHLILSSWWKRGETHVLTHRSKISFSLTFRYDPF